MLTLKDLSNRADKGEANLVLMGIEPTYSSEKSWGSFKVMDVESGSMTIKVTLNAGHRHTIKAETELKVIKVQIGEAISVHDKEKFEMRM